MDPNVCTDFVIQHESTTAEDAGRLTVRHLGIDGRICSLDWTDEDAHVYCREQGYTSGIAYSHSHERDYTSQVKKTSYMYFTLYSVHWVQPFLLMQV
jgi:hypothetical protein